MTKKNINNILLITSCVVLTISVFILFSNIRNYFLIYPELANKGLVYIILIIDVLASVILIVSSISNYKINQERISELNGTIHQKNKEIENFIRKKDKEKEEQLAGQTDKKNDFDAIKLIKKIIPGENKNTTLKDYTEQILINLSKEIEIVEGLFYIFDSTENLFKNCSQYAYYSNEEPQSFAIGEGLSGQVAKNQKTLLINNVPEGYINVFSGLGASSPSFLVIIPVIFESKTLAIIELASFKEINNNLLTMFQQFSEEIAENINNLAKVQKS